VVGAAERVRTFRAKTGGGCFDEHGASIRGFRAGNGYESSGASCMDGTASLANRDFGRVSRTKRRKVLFSGAARHANEAAGAGYSADSGRESAEMGFVGGER